jgi:hypothetical protein
LHGSWHPHQSGGGAVDDWQRREKGRVAEAAWQSGQMLNFPTP